MSLRCTALEIHLRHQIGRELVIYLNAATLRVRHQQTTVRCVECYRGGLGEGPLRLRTMDLPAALEIVCIRRHSHLGPHGELLGVAHQTGEETTLSVKDLNTAPVPGVPIPRTDIDVAVKVHGHVGRILHLYTIVSRS